jgi:phosphoglycerate dehydrogenase-like enzyme
VKAVFHHRVGAATWAHLERAAPEWLHLVQVDPRDEQRFLRELASTDVLLHVLAPVGQAVISQAPALRLIQKVGVGVDAIDLDAARRRGIAVTNMPGINAQAVAEATLLLMLATLRKLPLLHEQTRLGCGWEIPPALLDEAGELQGRTIGLVGFGSVARRLARTLAALDATVLFCSREPHNHATAKQRDFERLLGESDIVSLHLPLVAQTAGLLDSAAIARMKSGAILINTARGGLVDEMALVGALERGQVAAAGLDVFALEPPPPASRLLTLPNVVLTPHAAWLTRETLLRSIVAAAENCQRLRSGEQLLNRVV